MQEGTESRNSERMLCAGLHTDLFFLCSPGLRAYGMVVPTMDWALLYQLPTKFNPHRHANRESLSLGSFLR